MESHRFYWNAQSGHGLANTAQHGAVERCGTWDQRGHRPPLTPKHANSSGMKKVTVLRIGPNFVL